MPLSSHRKGWKPARSKVQKRRTGTTAEALQARKQRRKEKEIGTDPIYRGGGEAASRAWKAVEREWDRKNAGAFY